MGIYKVYFIETSVVLRQMLFGSYDSVESAELCVLKYLKCLYKNEGETKVSMMSDNCIKFQNDNPADFFIIRKEENDFQKPIKHKFPKKIDS